MRAVLLAMAIANSHGLATIDPRALRPVIDPHHLVRRVAGAARTTLHTSRPESAILHPEAEGALLHPKAEGALLHPKAEGALLRPKELLAHRPAAYAPSSLGLMSPRKVVVLGGVVNALLSVLKLIVGLASGSVALIADAGHSLSDLLSDALCMWAQIMPACESAATIGISMMLLTTGATMVCHSAGAIAAAVSAAGAAGAGSAPAATARAGVMELAGLAVALASVASKEALFRITHAVGLRQGSSSLVANAHHHRSDAMSSAAATLGIGGSIAGFGCFDPLAALVVGGMIVKMGIETAAGGH